MRIFQQNGYRIPTNYYKTIVEYSCQKFVLYSFQSEQASSGSASRLTRGDCACDDKPIMSERGPLLFRLSIASGVFLLEPQLSNNSHSVEVCENEGDCFSHLSRRFGLGLFCHHCYRQNRKGVNKSQEKKFSCAAKKPKKKNSNYN